MARQGHSDTMSTIVSEGKVRVPFIGFESEEVDGPMFISMRAITAE